MDNKRSLSSFGRAAALALALLFALGACAALTAPSQGSGGADAQVVELQRRVAALETRVIAQQSQIGALQTGGARAATPQPPTPTPVPPVTGLPVDGASKGATTAKVTLTEYTDFL
ncbi:MAG: hypothetical protein ACYC4L_08095 [Chloroflexota bacterium]